MSELTIEQQLASVRVPPGARLTILSPDGRRLVGDEALEALNALTRRLEQGASPDERVEPAA